MPTRWRIQRTTGWAIYLETVFCCDADDFFVRVVRCFAPQLSLAGPVFGQFAVDARAVSDKVAVVVRADSEVVIVSNKGAVQFRVESTDYSLVTHAAAEAAVLVIGAFKLNTDFAPGGVMGSAVNVLSKDAAAGFAVSVLAAVGVTYCPVGGELPGFTSGGWD